MDNHRELKVKDHEGLYRVPSGAIVNKDPDAYQKHLMNVKKERRLDIQDQRINNIESELSEIKSLLKQLLDKA